MLLNSCEGTLPATSFQGELLKVIAQSYCSNVLLRYLELGLQKRIILHEGTFEDK